MAEKNTGSAWGWQVIPLPYDQGWQWSAYGARGGESGKAATEAAATAMAKQAFERLRRPLLRSVGDG